MTQAWLEQKERSNNLAMRFLVWVALSLGRPLGRVLLYPICVYFLLFSVKSKAASRQYLAKILERPPTTADVFRHYYVFATVALDRMFLLRNRFSQFDVEVHGEEILAQARDRNEPCFLLGAHFGSFAALHVFGEEKNIKVTMMMFERNSRNVNALARAISPDLDRVVIEMGSVDSMMKVNERLEEGDWVGMLGDRRLFDSGAVRVPFLGAIATLPTAPFRIAAIVGRPMVFMVALYRGGNRYELHFERLPPMPKFERGKRDEQIRECAARYAQRLEYYCRLAPYNWFNFYDFWAEANAHATA
ncbi:MAG TPA: acyl-CoA synthetase [Burkholderiales bacterium]|nr:acyl-CoA synthetase [Burkholderiales bacterium]